MNQQTRRIFVRSGLIAGASLLGGAHLRGAADEKKSAEKAEEGVSPAEDLMREHGVLKRVLLVYGAIRRMEANEDLPPDTISESAKIIRNFIEDYHEKLEE